MALKISVILSLVISITLTTHAQECHVPGSVNGIYHYSRNSTSYNNCLDLCKTDNDCQCFTYFGTNDDCVEFSDCISINPAACTNCYSGFSDCPTYLECDIQGLCQGSNQ